MSSAEGGAPLLEVLADYFSPPLARALLTSTLRRARLDAATLTAAGTRQAVQALEAALPLYLGDPTRRAECLARLRARTMQASGAADGRPAPAPHAAPGAISTSTPFAFAPSSASYASGASQGASAAQVGPAAHPVAPAYPAASAHPPASVRARAAEPDPAGAPIVIQVASADDVVNVCEIGRDMARRIGFSPVVQTKIATAIAELARNILLYATVGEVRIVTVSSPHRGIEVDASDRGPGIADIEHVMSGAYRSRTGMGMGLRGAKRLMDDFSIESSPAGTRVIVRKYLQ